MPLPPISRRSLVTAGTIGVLGHSALGRLLHAGEGDTSCPAPSFSLQPNRPAPPDIVFISIDDLNDWVSPLRRLFPGGSDLPLDENDLRTLVTPNLDRFANQAVRFQRAYTESPACGPARSAVLSGLAPWKSGAVDVNHDVFAINRALNLSTQEEICITPDRAIELSLPAALRIHGGYRCYGAGKIFHRFTDGITRGAFGVGPNGDLSYSTGFGTPSRVEGAVDISGQVVTPRDLSQEFDVMVANQAVDWINANRTQSERPPMFLGVGFSRPHIPWRVEAGRFNQILAKINNIPKWDFEGDDQLDLGLAHCVGLRDRPGWSPAQTSWVEHSRRAIAGYLAAIAVSDEMFGRVIDTLGFGGTESWKQATGRDLVVMLWSDHGYGLGLRRGWTKFRFHHEIARVPLMIHDSKATATFGQDCDKWVSIRDLYLTTLKYAGFDRPGFLNNDCAGLNASLKQLVNDPNLGTWDRSEQVISYQYRSILESEENFTPTQTCAQGLGLPAGVVVKKAPIAEACVPSALSTASHALIFRDANDGSEWSYFYLRHHRVDGTSLFERTEGGERFDVAVPNEELYCLKAATTTTIATSDPIERTNLLKDRADPHYTARRAKANWARARLETLLGISAGGLPTVEWPTV